MIIGRREFLGLLGVSAGGVGLGGCRLWWLPDDRVEKALRGPGLESRVQTVCGLCEGGCGLTVRLVDGLPVGLKGNPRHPLNRGGLCPVGQAGLEVLYAPDRVHGPLLRNAAGELVSASWEEALGTITERMGSLVSAGDGSRFALLHDEPGQLFGELAERFVHAVGSPNVARPGDPSALPFKLTQGLDELPGFDLAGADLVLAFGLDLYEDGPAPLHAISALVGSRSSEERAALIHVGSRLSPSASKAEQRIPVAPGTCGAFALGLANVLVREGYIDSQFVEEHTFGFEDWSDSDGTSRLGFRRLLLERYYPDRVAQLTGVEPATIVSVARRVGAAQTPVAIAGGEATAASNATWTAMAVHSLNALLGSIDRPGGVVLAPPLPLTTLPPLRAPADTPSLFAAGDHALPFGVDPVESLVARTLDGSYPTEVLFLVSTNPVHDSASGQRLKEALERIPLVVAFASFLDDTAALADVVLPTPVFLETWQGITTPPTTAVGSIGLGKPVIEPLHDTRHPADVLLELGRSLGGATVAALPWESWLDYLEQRIEGLEVSGEGAVISGLFEESWAHFLEERGWRFSAAGGGRLWQRLTKEAGWWNPVRGQGDWSRLFATESGRFEFFSQDLEQRLVATGQVNGDGRSAAVARGAAALGLDARDDEACLPHFEAPRAEGDGDLVLVPFRPITVRGRLAAASPMLLEMFAYPHLSGWETFAEIAAETAHGLDLHDGDIVNVESDGGAIEAVLRIQPGAVPATVHVSLGLGHSSASFGAGGGVGTNPLAIVLPVHDDLSGGVATAGTRIRLSLVSRRPHGAPPPTHGGEA